MVVLLPVEVDRPERALFVKPVLVTVAVSPSAALTQVLRRVSVADLRVLVCVQTIAVSAAPIVSVLPDKPGRAGAGQGRVVVARRSVVNVSLIVPTRPRIR